MTAKIFKRDLIKLKKKMKQTLFNINGSYQPNEKANYGMGKIFANDMIDKGLISEIYKQLMQLNINKQKKKTQPING